MSIPIWVLLIPVTLVYLIPGFFIGTRAMYLNKRGHPVFDDFGSGLTAVVCILGLWPVVLIVWTFCKTLVWGTQFWEKKA